MYSQFQVVYTSKNTKINRQKFGDYRDLLQDHSEEKDIERVWEHENQNLFDQSINQFEITKNLRQNEVHSGPDLILHNSSVLIDKEPIN